MTSPLVVGSVPGVAPGKWARIWGERFPRQPLELRDVPASAGAELGGDDGIHVCFVRLHDDDDATEGGERNAVRLWSEVPVVVASRDHAIKLFDSVTEADIADEPIIAGEDDSALDIVATGAGIARMPQAVFRAASRRELVARPIEDAAPTRIALVWPRDLDAEREAQVQELVGIVRGRGADTSRGAAADDEPDRRAAKPSRPARKPKPVDAAKAAAARAKRAALARRPRKGR